MIRIDLEWFESNSNLKISKIFILEGSLSPALPGGPRWGWV